MSNRSRCPGCGWTLPDNSCRNCRVNYAGTVWGSTNEAAEILGVSTSQVRKYGPHKEELLRGTYNYRGHLKLDMREVDFLHASQPDMGGRPWDLKGYIDPEEFKRSRDDYIRTGSLSYGDWSKLR